MLVFYLLLGILLQYLFLDIQKNSALQFNLSLQKFFVFPLKVVSLSSYFIFVFLVLLIPVVYYIDSLWYSKFLDVLYVVEFTTLVIFCVTFALSSSLMLKAIEMMYSEMTKLAIDKKTKFIVFLALVNFSLAIMSRVVFEILKPGSEDLR
jgi:hypothetical protein